MDLEDWWMTTAQIDLEGAKAKLEEYGSGDLVPIGDDLARLAAWDDCPDRVKAELGIHFYHRGKVARATSSYERHVLPSDDTWHDKTVYTMMARRVRAIGEWR